MEKRNTAYTVHQVATLAGVSVRTLHHYDQIKLLRPSSRTAAGYRLYGEADLLRLQQILFFRELDFPLGEIQRILDDPGFDQIKALESHRRMLPERAERLALLLSTVDKTIQKLTEDTMTLTDAELYEGFSQEQIERYKREVKEQYDPKLVAESDRRVRKMSKAQWQVVGEDGKAAARRMAELMDRDPAIPKSRRRSRDTTRGSRTSMRRQPRCTAGWANYTLSTRNSGHTTKPMRLTWLTSCRRR